MNTKNKVGLYLIIAGAALLLLTTAAIFSIKKGFIKGVEFSCSMPENSLEEDVEMSFTDAPSFIDDTISDYPVDMAAPATVAAPAAPAPTAKPVVKTTAKPITDIAEKPKTTPAASSQPKPKSQSTITTSKTNSAITDNYAGKTSTNKPLPSGTNEFTIGGMKIIVEFWNPDKNFKGYHLSISDRTLKLFGIDQYTPLRFTKEDDGKLLMYYRNIPYLLLENRDIEPLQQYSE
ncbi:MAG: hypothetical protein LBR45_02505 [Bacteroidales bacterium]|jgi:hypothetical protein|nr:hypothetical protein [Bacteroidales bacterium]